MENAMRTKKIILVLGGARSGKSRWAEGYVREHVRRPVYVATAEAGDKEMADRIAKHRRDRDRRWRTVEAPIDVAGVLANPPRGCDGILVDCLTLWLSNVILKEGAATLRRRVRGLIAAVRACPVTVVLVSNEVGMGVVPVYPLGRDFRDASGWMNQDVARAADEVVFVVAGMPFVLKAQGR
jgi:adenosylcobinamide kinase/adenosylcobinamide-phosphate guanylyltransferase